MKPQDKTMGTVLPTFVRTSKDPEETNDSEELRQALSLGSDANRSTFRQSAAQISSTDNWASRNQLLRKRTAAQSTNRARTSTQLPTGTGRATGRGAGPDASRRQGQRRRAELPATSCFKGRRYCMSLPLLAIGK